MIVLAARGENKETVNSEVEGAAGRVDKKKARRMIEMVRKW